jgi:hypothetical protein
MWQESSRQRDQGSSARSGSKTHTHASGACHVSFGSATGRVDTASRRPATGNLHEETLLHSWEDLRAALHSPCGFVSIPAFLEPPNNHLSFLGDYAENSSTFPIADFPHLVAVDTEYPIYFCFYRSPQPPLIRHTALESCLHSSQRWARGGGASPHRGLIGLIPCPYTTSTSVRGPSRRRVGGKDEDKPG